MADRRTSPAAGSQIEDYRAHAEFNARASGAGVGAAAVSSEFENGEHVWECIISDGSKWHYVRVVGRDLGAHPSLAPEDVEQGIERFAATLPAQNRIRYVLNANPLHIERDGTVRD
jgi:hypothetical protein